MSIEQDYLERIKAKLPYLRKPERAEYYRTASVMERLLGFGDPENPTWVWHFDDVIFSFGSCNEPHPDNILGLPKITTTDPFEATKRTFMRVPLWYWDNQWEILEREVSGYRTSHYGFKD